MKDNGAFRVMLGLLLLTAIVALVLWLSGCAGPKRKNEWRAGLRVYKCGNLILETESGGTNEGCN